MNYDDLIARLERYEAMYSTMDEAAAAIRQLVAERDSHAKQCCKLAEEVIELEDEVDEHEHRITKLTAERDHIKSQFYELDKEHVALMLETLSAQTQAQESFSQITTLKSALREAKEALTKKVKHPDMDRKAIATINAALGSE